MKRKGSMLRAIVLRFVCYSLGSEMVIAVMEEMFRAFVSGADRVFLYERFMALSTNMQPGEIMLAVLWGALQVMVYGLGVFLFARGIHRMLRQQIKEREQERMQLFSNIAHDIKTPMTTIAGYAGALADGMVEDADKQREYLLAIKAKSGQMNGLIDQLLSYSKLGTAEYHINLARTDMAELLRAACASQFGEMESKRMELELHVPDEPVLWEIDALEIHRAVGNLLTNAIRHNPAGTLLYVGLAQDGEHIDLHIADSGEAIPDAIAQSLFDPFVSGNDARGGGTGLGLAIVKKVAEQHSGEAFVAKAPAPYTKMFVLRIKKGIDRYVPQPNKE